MSSLLAPTGPTALDWAGDLLAEACRERLWAWSDPEIIDRVAAAVAVRAQADAVLLSAVGEVEAAAWPAPAVSRSERAIATFPVMPLLCQPGFVVGQTLTESSSSPSAASAFC